MLTRIGREGNGKVIFLEGVGRLHSHAAGSAQTQMSSHCPCNTDVCGVQCNYKKVQDLAFFMSFRPILKAVSKSKDENGSIYPLQNWARISVASLTDCPDIISFLVISFVRWCSFRMEVI